MYRRDAMLAFIASGPDHGYSNFQMQKGMFILSARSPNLISTPYVFSVDLLGPFCRDIYQDARMLEAAGYVAISNRFVITPHGRCAARSLAEGLERSQRLAIRAVASFVGRRRSSLSLIEFANRLYQDRTSSEKPTASLLLDGYTPRPV